MSPTKLPAGRFPATKPRADKPRVRKPALAARVRGRVQTVQATAEQMWSQLQTIQRWEREQARRLRASCLSCGHMWTPRNPNPTVNRCPGCGARGRCQYAVMSTEAPTRTPQSEQERPSE